MSDYLWDRTGPPDAEVQQLEQLLSPLALQRKRAAVPPRSFRRYEAIAAAIILCVAAWRMLPDGAPQLAPWKIADGGPGEIRVGELVRTSRSQSMTLELDDVGRIELRPMSELRILHAAEGKQRMELRVGHMHALIWAPPRQFIVETPSARAVDLGCQYDLTVDSRGDGFLRVETGWVAFQTAAGEAFIPAGAACRTTKVRGPGIPYFEDAPAEFREALDQFERTGRHEALARVLGTARTADGLTLWHLLGRVPGADRGAVFDRFAQIVQLPPTVAREAVIRRDPAAIDACWNALGLADTEWWREWKRDWRQ